MICLVKESAPDGTAESDLDAIKSAWTADLSRDAGSPLTAADPSRDVTVTADPVRDVIDVS